jgi:hypothetical protein
MTAESDPDNPSSEGAPVSQDFQGESGHPVHLTFAQGPSDQGEKSLVDLHQGTEGRQSAEAHYKKEAFVREIIQTEINRHGQRWSF